MRSLGLVSFFADLSSETIYPLFGFFVTIVLGAPVAVLGLIEGLAEATASLAKYPFGMASDHSGRRKLFVTGGYGLAALGKLILALAFVWPLALAGRFVDRLGKGMRTAPRDALIAASSGDEERGVAFGLHRSMDTLGAVLGPLLALALIHYGVSLRTIFALAVVPGVASVLVIVWLVRERAQTPSRVSVRPALPASRTFRWLLAGMLLFAVGNSTDMFILLKAQVVLKGASLATLSEKGHVLTYVILLYVLYNLVYSVASLPLGHLSDRVGQFPVVFAGLVMFALVYAGFAAAGSLLPLIGLFAAYGLYMAATEGASKALVTRAVGEHERASALGLYATATGLASFAASAVGGILWSAVAPWATFAYGAACAALAAGVLLIGTLRGTMTAEKLGATTQEAGE